MVTEEFRELTVRIPEKAGRRLDRAAKRNRQPPEVVAARLIAQSLAVDITEIDFTIDELFERMASLTT